MNRRGLYKRYHNDVGEEVPHSTYYKKKSKLDDPRNSKSLPTQQDFNDKCQSDSSEGDNTVTSRSQTPQEINRPLASPSYEPNLSMYDAIIKDNNGTPEQRNVPVFDDFNDEAEEIFELFSKSEQSQDKKIHDTLTNKICDCFNINVGEILLIVMNIMKKHSLAWTVIIDIFLALNFIFNKKLFPVTKFMIRKLMKVKSDVLSYHLICQECKKYLGKHSKLKGDIICKCGNIINSSAMGTFFIEIDIIDQLTKLFSNSVILNNLDERLNRQKKNPENLEDIYDGAHYKKQKKFFENQWNLSYTFNTDGCAPADKGKITAWPLFLMFHELSDKLRKKFMILTGLWVAKAEPTMNIFLQPFVDQANNLFLKGFTWSKNGVKILSKLCPLGCCVDSVCRCAMLNMKRFNGIFGCTFCEHPTTQVDGTRKYPMLKNVPLKRTDESIKSQMIKAAENNQEVFGVWGPSCLMNLKGFDLSNGMIVDFMHSVLLGVIKLHTEILLSSTGAKFYVGSKAVKRIIDQRLLSIKPPTCIANTPKSIDEKNNWKASHWLIWLIFCSLPCLKGLLPKKYLNHLALLVTAINILLQDSISSEDFKTAKLLLVKFVYRFNIYFGDKFMHYNIHLLLHLPHTVKNWGPLWAINTFPFEDQNRHLLNMKKSNFHIAKQIAIRMLTYQQIPQLETEQFITQQTKDFCEQLTTQRLKKVLKLQDCTLAGNGKNHTLTENEIRSLQFHIDVKKINDCKKYKKIIYQSCRYTACSYSRNKKRNDSVFETTDKRYGIITSLYLIKHEDKDDIFIFYKELKLQSTSIISDSDVKEKLNMKKCSIYSNDTYKCINYSKLHRPSIIFEVDEQYYLSVLPKGVMGYCIN